MNFEHLSTKQFATSFLTMLTNNCSNWRYDLYLVGWHWWFETCVYCPTLMISIDEHRFFMEWLNQRWLNGGWTDEHPAILMWTGGHRNWEFTSKNMEMTSRIEGESWLVNINDDLSDLSRRNEEFDHQHSKTSSIPSLSGFTFLTSLPWPFFKDV
jgi:hypothetical protein